MGDPAIDPAVWEVPEMRAALAQRDIGTVFRLLKRVGLSQRDIGELTGTKQSEISEIVQGRQVLAYDVLERICKGLGIPRGYMGLSYDVDTQLIVAPPEHEEVDEIVKRRAYLAAVSGALVGKTYLGGSILGEPLTVAWDRLVAVTSTPLPVTIGKADVAALRALTAEMRTLGRSGHAGMPEVLAPVTQRSDRLLTVAEGSEANLKALHSAAAELHTLTGWFGYDMHLFDLARWHCDRGMRLASDAEDVPAMVSAALHAGLGEQDHNDALKLCQMALSRSHDAPSLQRHLHVESAWRYSQIDRADQADRELKAIRELAPLTDPFEAAIQDLNLGSVELGLDRLNRADHLITTAVRTFDQENRRDGLVRARITLATTHAKAGEPDTERLVPQAIEAVTAVPSVRQRAKLAPLEAALAARHTSTFTDLAQRVRALRTGTA